MFNIYREVCSNGLVVPEKRNNLKGKFTKPKKKRK